MLDNYAYDGTDNSDDHPAANVAGSAFVRVAPANFGPNGSPTPDLPNPRVVSNVLVAGNGTLEGMPYAGMVYAWGQFIDHDLDLGQPDGKTDDSITIPDDDQTFAPGSTIPQTRLITDPATGNAINNVTGWLDASMIYGSDAATAARLRGDNGRMATSDGNNLPIADGQFIAGDVRADENPDLAALTTLMVREHNTWADHLQAEHPDWDGDHIYNVARAIVTAEIQNITFQEFLPLVVGADHVAPYSGYDPSVDPRIMQEFAGAAYRFGHSIVSEEISSVTNDGESYGERNLAQAFFESPATYAQYGGTDGLLRHLSADISQKMDIHIVDTLRNFLDDPPAGQDLAALNVSRGRDMGLASFNQTRVAFGLQPDTSFDQITSDPEVAANLAAVYGSVDKVDLWTGGLAEDAAPGALVGPTFQAIIARQFEALRAGDAKWFENQDFSPAVLDAIQHTTLSDIIMRNTDTSIMQENAFLFADRHASDVEPEHSDAPQLVIGTDADGAVVAGGDQDDTIVAGLGHNQMLIGSGGADRFVFLQDGNDDTIADFQVGSDRIELAPEDVASVHISGCDNGSAVIQWDDNTVKLAGVTAGSLDISDIVFGLDRGSALPDVGNL